MGRRPVSRRDVDDCGGAGQIGGDGAQRSTGVADEGAQIPLAQPWTVPRCRVDRFDEFDEKTSGGFKLATASMVSAASRGEVVHRPAGVLVLTIGECRAAGVWAGEPRTSEPVGVLVLHCHRAIVADPPSTCIWGLHADSLHPESGTTSGLVAYLDRKPAGWVRGRAAR